MVFDALTIAGIVSGALSGGFVIATAMTRAPSRSAHRRSSSLPLARDTRSRGRAVHARLGRPPLAWRRLNSSGRLQR